jgi:hypothetical protein
MKYIVYISTAVRLFSDTDLSSLLEESRGNNASHQLTGMLLFSDGTFVQVLEGDDEWVDATYDKISRDSRHKNIIVLDEGPLQERLFPEWSMGFRNVLAKDFSALKGYIDPNSKRQWLNNSDHPAMYILKNFVDVNRF